LHTQESNPSPPQQKQITSPQQDSTNIAREEKSINDDKDPNQRPLRIDYEEMLAQSQRNVDRSVAILTLASTLFCVLLALITILVAIAGAFGFVQGKNLKEAVKKAKVAAQRIESLKEDTEKRSREFSELTSHIPVGELSDEYKEKLDNLSRRFEFLEALGMALSPIDYINRGNALFEKKQFRLAEEAYNKALELEPNNSFAMLNKAGALCRQGKFEEALALNKRVQEIRPKDPKNLVNMAATLLYLGRPQEALDISIKLLEFLPGNPSALYNTACAYSRMKVKDKALDYLKKAIQASDIYRAQAKEDPDFQDLRDDSDFKTVLEAPGPGPASAVKK
jgi:tetratricopeptide (TPR) repeat protein